MATIKLKKENNIYRYYYFSDRIAYRWNQCGFEYRRTGQVCGVTR